MSCSCGHAHDATTLDLSGHPVAMSPGPVALHGRLICTDTAQMLTALDLLPDHASASRAEPGCLRFDIAQSEDPMIWTLSEIFADADAFAAHQTRTAASPWGQGSGALTRDFHRHDAEVLIRFETAQDRAGLQRLLTLVFGASGAARLADGRTRSLVAHIDGLPVGHIALTDTPAGATVAVHPALQGRGLDRALIAAAEALGAPAA